MLMNYFFILNHATCLFQLRGDVLKSLFTKTPLLKKKKYMVLKSILARLIHQTDMPTSSLSPTMMITVNYLNITCALLTPDVVRHMS